MNAHASMYTTSPKPPAADATTNAILGHSGSMPK
jgi:hypothetical protein